MGYWIFRKSDGSCLAIEETELEKTRIADTLGELAYDDPIPRLIARLLVAQCGGRMVPEYEPRDTAGGLSCS